MESAAIHSSEVHEVDSGIPMILFKGFFYLSVSPARRASPFSPSLPPQKEGCNRPPVLRTASLYGWRTIKGLRHGCAGWDRLSIACYGTALL